MTDRVQATQQPKRPRNDPRRARTRQRLVNAAIEIIRERGTAALSVSVIAKAAGIRPPSFYAHFKNADECLQAAVEAVTDNIRRIDTQSRRELFSKGDIGDRRILADFFENALDRWLRERSIVELLITYRLDPSALGQALRAFLDQTRADVTADLWDIAAKVELQGKYIRQVAVLADLGLAHWLWAVEMLLEDRIRDRRQLAAVLAESTSSVTVHGFIRMLQEQNGEEPRP